MSKTQLRGIGLAGVLALLVAGPVGAILIEKSTEGFDADAPPGPSLTIGSTVTWTYEVINDTGRPLTDLRVTDDQVGPVSCPSTDVPSGGSVTCTATGTVQAGQYANVGTATATSGSEVEESDSDPSHYFGVSGDIDIEKATEGVDADLPPGPTLAVGTTVRWTYTVTNRGVDPVTDVGVVDDQGVTVHCPATSLAAGESMACTASGTAIPGQYANLGTVTALGPGETALEDSDPSHYFGSSAAIRIEKATEGEDADLPPGPTLTTGDPVQWTYVVSNPGTEDVSGILVTDDQEGTVPCPATTLAAGEAMTCSLTGSVQAGAYENQAVVTGEATSQRQVSDQDLSHYVGEERPSVLEIPTLSPLALLLLAVALAGAAWLALRA